LQIFDPSGQEKGIPKSYYKGCHGAILMYDVSNQASFDRVQTWIDTLNQNCDDSVIKLLVANKADFQESS